MNLITSVGILKRETPPGGISTDPNDIQTCWHLQKKRCRQTDN